MGHAFQMTETDGRKVAVVTFDLPDKKVNTLSAAVLARAGAAGRPAGRPRPTCRACCSGAASPASSSPGPT